MMAGEEVDTIKFIPPDWFVGDRLRYHVGGNYRSFSDVLLQVQTDLGFLPPQPPEEEVDEGKRNPNNTGDQDMEEEGSHKQNRKRKRNNEDEDEKGNPNFDSSDDDDDEEGVLMKVKMGSWDMSIKQGDQFDIPTLLRDCSIDYLITNDGKKVEIKEHFSGKRVVLYFWNLSDDDPLPHVGDMCLHEDIKEIYDEFSPLGLFEVVFVALGNNKKVFDEAFSVMPWLAIPHENQKGRDMIEEKFAMKFLPIARSVFFDVDGTVLLHDCAAYFRRFGAEGFPFTEKRISEIHRDDLALWEELISLKKKPWKKLFGDFVFSNEGKPVSTSDLENCIVGLHFFDKSPLDEPWVRVLLSTWELLKDDPDKKFVIVSINNGSFSLSYFKNTFPEEYNDIPWYRLPCDGRKICRLLFIPLDNDDISSNAGHFIITERDKYQPLNYFALDVLELYGVEAFPFTLQRAVELEKKKQQKLGLCKLLSPSAPLCRRCSTRSKEDTIVSNLLGERVLLLFATNSCYGSGSFLCALKKMYLEKETNDHFEIIYISLDESQTDFSSGIQKMSWLVHSFVPHFALTLIDKVFGFTPRLPAIAAFGQDGILQTKESNLLFKEGWCSKYPFIQAEVDDEVCKELISRYCWDLSEVFAEFYYPQ